MNIKLLMASCLFLLTATIFAQPFTESPEAFQQEIMKFASEKIKSDKWVKQVEALTLNMNEGCLTSVQSKSLMSQYNRMHALAVRYNPHLYNYIKSVNQQCDNGQGDMNGWFKAIDALINNSQRGKYEKLSSFISFSNHFFKKQQLVTSKQRDWIFDSKKFQFNLDDKLPTIDFELGTLKAIARKDSLIIKNTKGNYSPFKKEWKGVGGTTDWKRGDWEGNSIANSAKAELSTYRVNMNRAEYRAQNVVLSFDYMLYKKIEGSIYDKLSVPRDGQVDFPQFDSYDKNIAVDNVDPNVRFKGGFGLYGWKMQVKGDTLTRASMKIYDESGNLQASAHSRFFGLKDRKSVYGTDTEVSVYIKQDSIYHPNLNLSYFISDRQLRLVRGEEASSKIAFMDGYHQMELNTDALEWNLSDTLMVFRKSTQIEDAAVTANSFNFYDRSILGNYKIGLTKDPIIILSNWSESMMSNEISGHSFAAQIKPHFTIDNVIGVVFDLVRDGFVYYDPLTQNLGIRNKARFYAQCAKDASDYDVLNITSQTNKTNFQINLDNNELLIRGVRQVELSDSQNVAIFPLNKTIQMRKNRDFYAFGDASAAAVDLVNGEYNFIYNDFNLNIDTVSQLLFYVPTLELLSNGMPEGHIPIKTLLHDLKGNIQIDASGNKSSRIDTEGFPILSVTSPSYIYYDNSNVFDGAYKRETFYFKLDPFVVEGLDNLQRSDLVFDGEMNYGNIFPDIRQTVTLQEDLTLGFTDYETKVNTPTYNGLGTFNGKINLSNKGLLADGNVEFMSTLLFCKEFVFLPELMLANADTMLTKKATIKGVEFPRVDNTNVVAKWRPYADTMTIKAKTPFDIFEAKMRLTQGDILITSKGMYSNGQINIEGAKFSANQLWYKSETVGSDSASLAIRMPGKDYDVLNAKETTFSFSPYGNLGEIMPNNRNIPVELEDFKFDATAEKYTWNRADSSVVITDQAGFLTSFNEFEDSLILPFKQATYRYNQHTIDLKGAEQISIADAYIMPNNHELTIRKKSRVDTLYNAIILADTVKQFHKISNATVKIKSRYEYEGEGDYVYRSDYLADQIMHLDAIKSKLVRKDDGKLDYEGNSWYTVSNTAINEDKGFLLDPRMNFKGAVFLDSRDPYLTFDGYGKIIMKSDLNTQWFQFKNLIDPNNVTIDLTKPISEKKDSLYVGLMMDYNDFNLKTAFLSPKTTRKDFVIFDSRGSFNYDNDAALFKVGDIGRITNEKLTNNILQLDDNKKLVSGNGKFNMGNFGMMNVDIAGDFTHDLANKEYQFEDLVLGVDFTFDKKLFEQFTADIKNLSQEADEVDYMATKFSNAIVHLFDEKKAKTVLTDLETKEYFDRPDKLNYKLLFSNLDMVWDTLNRSFISRGTIGLSYLGETYVNRNIEGFVEFVPRSSGDQLNIYFEFIEADLGQKVWYYFNYKKGVLQVISYNPQFNDGMNSINPKKSVITNKETGEIFQYTMGSINKKNNFVIRMMEAKQFYENKENEDK